MQTCSDICVLQPGNSLKDNPKLILEYRPTRWSVHISDPSYTLFKELFLTEMMLKGFLASLGLHVVFQIYYFVSPTKEGIWWYGHHKQNPNTSF